jgi:hypothetical protein
MPTKCGNRIYAHGNVPGYFKAHITCTPLLLIDIDQRSILHTHRRASAIVSLNSDYTRVPLYSPAAGLLHHTQERWIYVDRSL